MRIMTVREPWATLIIEFTKNVENRSRNIAGNYRGIVAIHSSRRLHAEDAKLSRQVLPHATRVQMVEQLGHIIGVVELTDAHHVGDETSCSQWATPDAWHLMLRNPRPLPNPIPYRGALGLRTLPFDIGTQIMEQLGSTQP